MSTSEAIPDFLIQRLTSFRKLPRRDLSDEARATRLPQFSPAEPTRRLTAPEWMYVLAGGSRIAPITSTFRKAIENDSLARRMFRATSSILSPTVAVASVRRDLDSSANVFTVGMNPFILRTPENWPRI